MLDDVSAEQGPFHPPSPGRPAPPMPPRPKVEDLFRKCGGDYDPLAGRIRSFLWPIRKRNRKEMHNELIKNRIRTKDFGMRTPF